MSEKGGKASSTRRGSTAKRCKKVGSGRGGKKLLVHDVHMAAVADGEEKSFSEDDCSIGSLVREDTLLRTALPSPL